MSLHWQTLLVVLLTVLASVQRGGGQLFKQPSLNQFYSSYVQSVGGAATETKAAMMLAATQLPNHVTVIKPLQLQEVTTGESLAPLLQQLLRQTVPNWQQPREPTQQQLPQQQQQHFFVYESSQPVRLTSQQPQILPGFNVQQQQQQPRQQPPPQSTSMPIQLQQQYLQYLQATPKIVAAPSPPATAMAKPIATTFPTATSPVVAASDRLSSGQANQTAPELCQQRCCDPEGAAKKTTTPCPCCDSGPLLSAKALKAAVG